MSISESPNLLPFPYLSSNMDILAAFMLTGSKGCFLNPILNNASDWDGNTVDTMMAHKKKVVKMYLLSIFGYVCFIKHNN